MFGNYGSNNDRGILGQSDLGKKYENKPTNLPGSEKLPGCKFELISQYLLGDEIFPFWILRPYSGVSLTEEQKIYNYRQSAVRRVIENADF